MQVPAISYREAKGFDHLGVALSIGFSVMAMIFAVGYISGGHFNPAVSRIDNIVKVSHLFI